MKVNITTLFLDIGGVLLSNGWDEEMREHTFKHFKLNLKETESRHHLVFDTFESGKMSIHEYLKQVVFYKPQSFSEKKFIDFIHQQAVPNQDSINFFLSIKREYQLQVIAISNEAREFTEYRVKKFNLRNLFDAVVSSSFVHLRKPDKDIFQLAIDISQADVKQSIYVDDRPMLVNVAKTLGLNGVCFKTIKETQKQFGKYGLKLN